MFYLENNIYDIHYYNQGLLPPNYTTTSFLDNAVSRLQSTYNSLLLIKNDSFFKESIFDKNINLKNGYGPSNVFQIYGRTTQGLIFDEVDLPLKLFQIAEAIFINDLRTLTNSQEPVMFLEHYLTPSFESLMK